MIEEDYVSIEIAKLLQEKRYPSDRERYGLYVDGVFYRLPSDRGMMIKDRVVYEAPTHQMVTKWLRDVYKLHIYTDYEEDRGFQPNILSMTTGKNHIVQMYNGYSHEQAIEEAIKYCLEKII